MKNDMFYEERSEMTTVYFEPRGYINQRTQFLHRLGLITLRNGAAILKMMGPIAIAIANRVGWSQNYEVYEAGIVNFIIICPGTPNGDQLVRQEPYRIIGNIEFDVNAWEPNINITFNPR
jgi:hypothetical protein